jgi:hypothetical protein
MKLTFSQLADLAIHAIDGELGRVRDVYVDGVSWKVRYIVVDTRRFVGGRRVLLSPQSVSGLNPGRRELQVDLRLAQVEAAPTLTEHVPMTRAHLSDLDSHYGWSEYWITGGPINFSFPTVNYGPIGESIDIPEDVRHMIEERLQRDDDGALVSFRDLCSYRIETVDDGSAGSIEDAIINYRDWTMPYLVIDTGHWISGRKVIVPASLVEAIDTGAEALTLHTSAESMVASPKFDPERLDGLDEARERELVAHYLRRSEAGWPGAAPVARRETDGDVEPFDRL